VLKGKTIVITGASGGIGQAIARTCAREGASLGLHSFRHPEVVQQLAQELKESYGTQSTLLSFDLKEPQSIEKAIQSLEKIPLSFDGWVNNAAVHHQGLLPIQSEAMIEEQIRANLLGTIYCCKNILPIFLRNKGGVILNMASVASSRVAAGQSVYVATKGGIVAFTRALAFEYARKKIRINAIEPGPIETEMLQKTQALLGKELKERIPMRRIGSPQEVAELAVFLLSEKASFITGSIYSVDGGYSLG
jgi:3-oxoacyl-[acyl-carrier protein] reductase